MSKVHKYINELVPGMELKDYYFAREILQQKTRTGKDYLRMTLHDRTGGIDAKHWDLNLEAWEKEPLSASEVLQVHIKTEEYAGKVQAIILAYQKLDNPSEKMLAHLVPTAPIDPENTFAELMEHVRGFKNSALRKIVQTLWQDNKDAILVFPASQRVHHAVRSGFLYHIARMMENAEGLVRVYPLLDRELLLTGVMLHDIGKLQEYDTDRFDLVETYSRPGNLLGHITLGSTAVAEVCQRLEIDAETTQLVMHLILAHHNYPEWGSPVRPAIPEALALHHLDALDAHLYVFEEVYENQNPGTFSTPVFFLERTKLYKVSGEQSEPEDLS